VITADDIILHTEAEVTDADTFEPFPLPGAVFFAVLGPGSLRRLSITMRAAFFTYSAAGAPTVFAALDPVPITVSWWLRRNVLAHGAVTGKGLCDLIREEFGLRITFL